MKVDLGPVQETLLIPLLARARETENPRGLLRDPRAVAIVRSLDYDFGKWEGGRSLNAPCSARGCSTATWRASSRPIRKAR